MKRIDVSAHIIPQQLMEGLREKAPQTFPSYEQTAALFPSLVDLDARFRIMDAFDDYCQVLTMVGSPTEEPLGGPKVRADLARLTNDSMAELVVKHPDRFIAFAATLPLPDVEASLRELERAVVDLGAKGVVLPANIEGAPLDEPRFLPVFEQVAGYDLPIWIHPLRSPQFPDFATEEISRYNLWLVFGWPYETAITLTRLVLAGLLKRFPNLKIISHHAGGLIPFLAERIRDNYERLQTRAEMHPILSGLEENPVDYLKRVYGDTALNGCQPALECALAFFGSERILFGSDFPFDIRMGAKFVEDSIRTTEGLPLTAAEKEAIYWRSAAKMLKLA